MSHVCGCVSVRVLRSEELWVRGERRSLLEARLFPVLHPRGRRGLAAGGGRLPGRVEGGVEAFFEGGAVAHPPGDGATAKGGAAVPGGKAACGRRPEEALGRLPAALRQGRCAGRPAGGAAGSSGQQ